MCDGGESSEKQSDFCPGGKTIRLMWQGEAEFQESTQHRACFDAFAPCEPHPPPWGELLSEVPGLCFKI